MNKHKRRTERGSANRTSFRKSIAVHNMPLEAIESNRAALRKYIQLVHIYERTVPDHVLRWREAFFRQPIQSNRYGASQAKKKHFISRVLCFTFAPLQSGSCELCSRFSHDFISIFRFDATIHSLSHLSVSLSISKRRIVIFRLLTSDAKLERQKLKMDKMNSIKRRYEMYAKRPNWHSLRAIHSKCHC